MKPIHFISALVLILEACHPQPQASSMGIPVSKSAGVSSCSFLTSDEQGRPVLSWIQQDSSNGKATLYYAVSTDEGKSFGDPVIIPPSAGVEPHGENMPKIIFKKDGEIIAAFGISAPHMDNDYTGKVLYTQSLDRGRTWSPATPLTTDTSSFDQRYFDLALLPDGEAGITWLNNAEQEGSTLYFAATDGHGGFGHPKVIGHHTCQCCRTDLFTDPQGFVHVAYRDISHDTLVDGHTDIRDMVYTVSADSGRTFSPSKRISPDNWAVNGCPHTGPDMASNLLGLHFVWYTMGGGGGVYYCHTSDHGRRFSPRDEVSRNPSAKHPQITTLPDGNLVIVWDESVVKNTQYHQRIGLQERNPEGRPLRTTFITPENGEAAFCMVQAMDTHHVLVSYTTRIHGQEKVCYNQVNLNSIPQ